MFKKILMLIWRAWILYSAAILMLLVGCSAGPFNREITGTPVPETVASGTRTAVLPMKPGYENRPDAYRQARLVDPCALHSPADAGRTTELTPDDIMPGSSLNICTLHLIRKPLDLPRWALTITVGVDTDDARRRGQVQDLADTQYWYVPPRPSSQPGRDPECRYVKEFAPGTGIELRVVNRDEDDRRDPCDLARSYLLAVTTWWTTPATRTDAVTAPSLAVASVDPCTAISGLAAEIGQPVHAAMTDPHNCSLHPAEVRDKHSYGALLAVDYRVESEPLAVLNGPSASDYQRITVADKPGTLTQVRMPSMGGPARMTCYVTVVADDQVTLQADQSRPDTPKSYQVVKTNSPDCDLAQRGAEAALAALR